MSIGPRSKKFNLVSNDHGRTQKCDFWVLVGKSNFTDHHTPDTINDFRDSVLVCKMQTFRALFPFLLIRRSHQAMQAFAMAKLNENKPLQNDIQFRKTHRFPLI